MTYSCNINELSSSLKNSLFNRNLTAQWLPDRSEYPAEASVHWLCGGVAANSRNCSLIEIPTVDSPK